MRTDTELLDGLMDCMNRGSCPGVINDDNGHWAVTDDGMQNAVAGNEAQDVQTTFFVPAAKWRKSIREAINEYLDEDEKD